MSSPLPVQFALGVSVVLGTAGLASLIGVWSAMESASGWGWAFPIAALALIACLVFAGENTKSRLLNWARERSDERGWKSPPALMGAGGFAFFVLVSVCLTHEGLTAGERAFLSPIVETLRADVSEARASLGSREQELSDAKSREDARVSRLQSEIDAQPRDWRGDRERDRLRDRIDAIEAGAPARLEPIERRVRDARESLAQSETALEAAPAGFSALLIALPFVGAVAFLPWLIAIGIEFLTGFVGWIAAPRAAPKREVYLTDILEMECDGLELLTNRETVRAIGSRAQSIATKAGHVLRRPPAGPELIASNN